MLSPEEHVPFLQKCVRDFVILHPETGERFPSELPQECLPEKADDDIVKWHQKCSDKLLNECTPAPTPSTAPGTNAGTPQSPRPRSSTEPNKYKDDGIRYAYGYAHAKQQNTHSFSATNSPRMRPADIHRDREDYFNSKPIPRRQKTGLSSSTNSRPGTASRLNTEDNDDLFARGRRKNAPKNYYSNPENVASPGSGRSTSYPPHSPRDERNGFSGFDFSSAAASARRHSHPRHRRVETDSSDGDSSASDDGVSESSSPEVRPMRSKAQQVREREGIHRSSSGRVVPEVRYSGPSPNATPSPRVRPVVAGGIIGGVTGVASRLKDNLLHRKDNLNVPGRGFPSVRTYRVIDPDVENAPMSSPRGSIKGDKSAAERAQRKLRHAASAETRHSTDTSGGSRSNSRLDRERAERGMDRERADRGNIRWYDLRDGVPRERERRHSDSPPHLDIPISRGSRESFERERERSDRERDRERERRRDREGEKFRRDDFLGRKQSSEEERKRRPKVRDEEAYFRNGREVDRERERERERAARLSERERRGNFYEAGVGTRR